MTDDTAPPDAPVGDSRDPFVVQLAWLVDAAGGQGTLARRSGVAERSLRSWSRGDYPKQNDSPAVRRLDAWARATITGYPTAAGVPALTETSGPKRLGAESALAAASAPAATEPQAESTRRRRWPVLAAVAGVLAAAAAVIVIVTSSGHSGATPKAAPTDSAALPTHGTEGASFIEESGSLGANTFADPVKLQDQALKIPPHTQISVRCYVYAPSIPSVLPDGNWYLIDTSPWTGRWTPANSFMNGDVPGGPTLHNTDFAVPKCH